jgi:hypothetical protein
VSVISTRHQVVELSSQKLAASSGIGGTGLIAMHWSVREQTDSFTPFDGIA